MLNKFASRVVAGLANLIVLEVGAQTKAVPSRQVLFMSAATFCRVGLIVGARRAE